MNMFGGNQPLTVVSHTTPNQYYRFLLARLPTGHEREKGKGKYKLEKR